jgi:hypothetical protein
MVTSATSSGIATPVSERVNGCSFSLGVQERPGAEHGVVGGEHVPGIGIVVPAGIGVLHGDVEPVGAVARGGRLGLDHVGLSGVRRQRRETHKGNPSTSAYSLLLRSRDRLDSPARAVQSDRRDWSRRNSAVRPRAVPREVKRNPVHHLADDQLAAGGSLIARVKARD